MQTVAIFIQRGIQVGLSIFKLIPDTSAVLVIIRIRRSFDGSYPGFLPQILGAAIVFLFARLIQYVDGSTLFSVRKTYNRYVL